MRAGKISRLVGRAAAIAVLGLGVAAVVGPAAAVANPEDVIWDAPPRDSVNIPTETESGPVSPSDVIWE